MQEPVNNSMEFRFGFLPVEANYQIQEFYNLCYGLPQGNMDEGNLGEFLGCIRNAVIEIFR